MKRKEPLDCRRGWRVSMAVSQISDTQNTASFFTVLLIGRTGMGKSTTANKLLNIAPDRAPDDISGSAATTHDHAVKQEWPLDQEQVDSCYFTANSTAESGTRQCKVLCNTESKVRVLDTVGFAGSNDADDVYAGNLRVMRQILGVSIGLDMAYDRVLYFLPERLVLEKAHGNLQEEIGVMWHFFGDAFFRAMTLVVTVPRYIDAALLNMDEEQVCEPIRVALKNVGRRYGVSDIPLCPPVITISVNDDSSKVTKTVRAAENHGNGESLCLGFREGVCAKCAINIYVRESSLASPYSNLAVASDKGIVAPGATKCHPNFNPKYSLKERIKGGFKHIFTLGTVWLHQKNIQRRIWPGFFCTEEICVNCGKSPGKDGCWAVSTEYEGHCVEHTNNINSYVYDYTKDEDN